MERGEMMNCRAVRQHVSAHFDGELEPTRDAGVRSHLEQCDDCARYRRELAELAALLDAPPATAAREGFTADVLARVRERQAESAPARLRRSMWRPISRGAVAVAVAAAISLGAGLGWLTAPTAEPTPTPEAQIAQQFGLEAFDELPENSLADAYVQIVWSQGGDVR